MQSVRIIHSVELYLCTQWLFDIPLFMTIHFRVMYLSALFDALYVKLFCGRPKSKCNFGLVITQKSRRDRTFLLQILLFDRQFIYQIIFA